MYVIVPLQLASTRVKRKNIKPFFGGESLFDIKAKQLLEVVPAGSVYVSSESDEVRPLAEKYGFHFLRRAMELTGNQVTQPDLIGGILADLPKDGRDIMWVQVTQPLFRQFREMLDQWASVKDAHDSIAAVKRLSRHVVSEQGLPVNFNYGYWHRVTQNLPKFYELLWACYILKREAIEQVRYHLGRTPYFMPFNDIPLVDIDTESDFELAAKIYGLYLHR